MLSLPSRERGLKSLQALQVQPSKESLPSRERGLKSFCFAVCFMCYRVAPFAGAWIEIHPASSKPPRLEPSLPSRERELKYGFHRQSLPDPELYLILKILPSRQRQQKKWKNMYRITVSKEYPKQPIYWRPDIYRTLHQFQKNQPVTAFSICRRKVKNFWV